MRLQVHRIADEPCLQILNERARVGFPSRTLGCENARLVASRGGAPREASRKARAPQACHLHRLALVQTNRTPVAGMQTHVPVQVSGSGGSFPSVCSTEGAAFWVAARSARAVLSVLWVESRTLGHVGPWAGGTVFASTFGTVVLTVDVQPAG